LDKEMFKRSLSLFLVLVIVLVSGTFCSSEKGYQVSSRVDKLWKKYPDPWNQEKAFEAAEEAGRLWEKHPEDIQLAKYYIARMQVADPSELSRELRLKLRQDVSNAYLMLLEAMINASQADYISTMHSVYQKAPNDPFVISEYMRSILLLPNPDIERATDLAFRALEIAPELPVTNGRLAFILSRVGNNVEAENFARKAVRLAPNEFVYLETLSEVLDASNRKDEATGLLEEYNKLHPGNSYTSNILLKRYRENDEWEKMIPVKREAANLESGEGMAWIELAMLYRQIERHDSTFYYLNKSVDEGFYDANFFHFAFEESLADLKDDPRYSALLNSMEEKKQATRQERKKVALSEKLDIVAPSLVATDLNANPVKLEDGKGRVVVVYFWSTWSGWCRLAKPLLEKFYDNTGVETLMVGVNVREDIPKEERPAALIKYTFVDKTKWPVWMAEEIDAARFNLQVIPTIMVIDPEGVIRYQIVGYKPFMDETLQWMVDSLNEGDEE